jgi:hypothetical protein
MTVNVEGIPSNVAEFIKNFYAISDKRETTPEEYADSLFYDQNTTFQIGPMQVAKDRESVQQWRSKAYDVVQSRKHSIHAVYSKAGKHVIDPSSPECMLRGRVDYTLKDGKNSGADWGGHMVFIPSSLKEGEQPKMHQYSVWIVSRMICVHVCCFLRH